jgi:hypothetical protein
MVTHTTDPGKKMSHTTIPHTKLHTPPSSLQPQATRDTPNETAQCTVVWPCLIIAAAVLDHGASKKKNTHAHRHSFSGPENQDLIRS